MLVVLFLTTDCTVHWAPLRPQSFPTPSLREEDDQFMCSTEHAAKLHCLTWPTSLASSYMYTAEQQDARVQPVKVAQNHSNSFVSIVKLSDFGDEKECVWVFFCLFFFWVHPSKSKKYNYHQLPHQSNYFGLSSKIVADILRCPSKTCNGLQRGCALSDLEAFHLNSHKPQQFFFLSLDCIAHCGQGANMCLFFSYFCFIWPGNVSPKSMYKILWKLLIYKTMYKAV